MSEMAVLGVVLAVFGAQVALIGYSWVTTGRRDRQAYLLVQSLTEQLLATNNAWAFQQYQALGSVRAGTQPKRAAEDDEGFDDDNLA